MRRLGLKGVEGKQGEDNGEETYRYIRARHLILLSTIVKYR